MKQIDVENYEDRGVDFALEQLCLVLEVDPQSISWDAATETRDGDIQAVIGNILRAKFGEEPAAYRWRRKGSVNWIYNPESHWLADQDRSEIDVEPLYVWE
jgi:hypothetical protein